MKLRYCEKCGELQGETEVHECPPAWSVWYQNPKDVHLTSGTPITSGDPVVIHADTPMEAVQVVLMWDDTHNEFWLANDYPDTLIRMIVRGQDSEIYVIDAQVRCPLPIYEAVSVMTCGTEVEDGD